MSNIIGHLSITEKNLQKQESTCRFINDKVINNSSGFKYSLPYIKKILFDSFLNRITFSSIPKSLTFFCWKWFWQLFVKTWNCRQLIANCKDNFIICCSYKQIKICIINVHQYMNLQFYLYFNFKKRTVYFENGLSLLIFKSKYIKLYI